MEHKNEPVIPRRHFVHRMAHSFLVAVVVVAASLGLGAAGYHRYAGLAWIDATLNAAMILTGMGPVDPMPTAAAKLFATGYALFSGVVFLTLVAVILAPVAHRLMHRFHYAMEEDRPDPRRK